MQITAYNPAKGRYETISVTLESGNTTWFEDGSESEGIYSITDVDGDLLIRESGYSIPLLAQEMTRTAINFDQRKAREIIRQHQ